MNTDDIKMKNSFPQIGSFSMAICAKEMKKPFYVLTESFKFTRLYPLNQRDLPDEFKVSPLPSRNKAHFSYSIEKQQASQYSMFSSIRLII
jgi:translation initiation factor eIF-2B subunit alpha